MTFWSHTGTHQLDPLIIQAWVQFWLKYSGYYSPNLHPSKLSITIKKILILAFLAAVRDSSNSSLDKNSFQSITYKFECPTLTIAIVGAGVTRLVSRTSLNGRNDSLIESFTPASIVGQRLFPIKQSSLLVLKFVQFQYLWIGFRWFSTGQRSGNFPRH